MTDAITLPRSKVKSIVPQFAVADPLKSAEHYRDKLGFSILGTFGEPPVFAMVARDRAEIHFGQADSPTPVPNSRQRKLGSDAYLHVDCLDNLVAELRERGADIVEGPVLRIYGMRELTVRDNCGYLLVFGESDASVALMTSVVDSIKT